jgi:hypothetical protein
MAAVSPVDAGRKGPVFCRVSPRSDRLSASRPRLAAAWTLIADLELITTFQAREAKRRLEARASVIQHNIVSCRTAS